jgi:hypothetical protein
LGLALAIVGGLAWISFRSVIRRAEQAERYRTAVDRYAEYAESYRSAAVGEGVIFSSCYGGRWDQYSKKLSDDIASRRGDKSHLEERAAHYERLKREYQEAISRPDAPVDPDPPHP